jgi:hypothetical protein
MFVTIVGLSVPFFYLRYQVLGLQQLQVFGDSKLVIESVKGNISLQNLTLKPLFTEVKFLEINFTMISFTHIYKELNVQAKKWSKKALAMPMGEMEILKDNDGVVFPAKLHSLYN